MKFGQFKNNKSPEFMIIPLIDVIFFLLVFFMMNSLQTTTQRAMGLQLPQAASAEAVRELPVVITLDVSGHIMVDGQSMSFTEAGNMFKTRVAANPNLSVVLQADKQTAHGQVAAVMDMLKQSGVKKLGIAADKKG